MDRNLPRLFAGSPDCIKALDQIEADPAKARDGLIMACGALQGSKMPGCAASVLWAIHQLFPEVKF